MTIALVEAWLIIKRRGVVINQSAMASASLADELS
jgi:hypothetical protein